MSKERKYRGKQSRPIPVWNGIFEHHGRIGEALWEFLWCIDRITEEHDGVGRVFGGAPVKLERIAADLNGDKESVRRHLRKLEAGKYIRMRRTPYGQIIEVLHSKKFGIWRKEKPQSAVSLQSEKPIGESEKPTYESEKPQSAVSKEDAAKDAAKDAAAKCAAASPNPAWTGIGLDRPVGDQAFRRLWESAWATSNGHRLSKVMGDVTDLYQDNGGTVPGPFFARLAEIRKQEKAAAERACSADAHTRRMPTVKDIRPKER